MYIETVPNRNSRPTILLREGRREGKRVRKRTLANLTHWPAHRLNQLRKLLKDQPLVSPEESFSIERSLPHGHIELILEAVRRLQLPGVLDPKGSPERDRVLAMIVERIAHPASKLATTRLWHTTTLAEELALGEADEDDLYRAMDWLLERQPRIERRLAARHLSEAGQVLYDVTSSYYEGHTCPLTRFGYSRDGKRARPIVVYGVMSDVLGRPVAVQVYAGNTADPKTVPDQVQKLRERFGLQRVVLVGDRGMLTETQIEHLKRHPGLGWVSALRHRAIRQLVEGEALQLSLFDERNLAEIRVEHYPGERLIVCHNPMLAEHRRRKREKLLAATEEALDKIVREVSRRTKTPLSEQSIAEKVGRVKNRFKVAKHFETVIEGGQLRYARRAPSIEREAALDGFYVLRTSEPAERLDTAEVVRSYKNLTRIERAFRCIKTVDLQVRPIYHRTEARVRAHIFLCVLAYYVEWHLREALAPLLFHDEQRDAMRARLDPVAPTAASASAQRKKAEKQNEEGLPVHSFKTLLAELATRCRHWCRWHSDPDAPLLHSLTEPTALQQRALDLVKSFPVNGIPSP